jgi:hypothetical protein
VWQIQSIPTLEMFSGEAVPGYTGPTIAKISLTGPIPYVFTFSIVFNPGALPVAQFEIRKSYNGLAGPFIPFDFIPSTATQYVDNPAGATGQTVAYVLRYYDGVTDFNFSNVISQLLDPSQV